MPNFKVNNHAQANGDHEVHQEGCRWLALTSSTTDLGHHTTCSGAVAKAKTIYRQSNGCATCAPACHTQ
ncbi:hypothetical protein C8029_16425 [Roseobacter sp. TSBP12]|nr:hypothetical protein C8029_16425 [Roseobacter sp. TSBP12]